MTILEFTLTTWAVYAIYATVVIWLINRNPEAFTYTERDADGNIITVRYPYF